MNNINNIILRLLTDKRFSPLWHFILAIVILVITLSFIWYDVPVINVPVYYKLYAWIIYILILGGIIYTNIYACVPRLLLKNKLEKYAICLLVFTAIFILSIAFTQIIVLDIKPSNTFNIYSFLVNTLSASAILIFLFLGTTSLVLVKYWIIADLKKSTLESSVLESELKLLKNQVNPHFLFNMLNNANMLLKKDKAQASDVLFKLEDLLRYQINDSTKEEVLLSSEIRFVNDFLNLEKIRRDNFEYTIQAEGNVGVVKIPPLLFILFVENAIKHNPENEHSSFVKIEFRVKDSDLEFICENSKPESPMMQQNTQTQGGLGLKNIRRRLELLFPDNYNLQIVEQQLKYTVKLRLTL